MAQQGSERSRTVVVILSLSLLYAAGVLIFQNICDDAYISFRYARNLVDGHGLVWNPGEWVEGYTNFLWVLILALGMKLGVDPATTAAIGGVLAGAAVLWLLAQQCKERIWGGASSGLAASGAAGLQSQLSGLVNRGPGHHVLHPAGLCRIVVLSTRAGRACGLANCLIASPGPRHTHSTGWRHLHICGGDLLLAGSAARETSDSERFGVPACPVASWELGVRIGLVVLTVGFVLLIFGNL